MNKELSQELKNYNWLEKLQVDRYVDAKDENRWKVAKILSIRHYPHRVVITLRFDGYPSRWNQDFELPASSKLAPFRRFTLPYTGPLNHHHFDVTRDSPDMDFEPHLKQLTKISNFEKIKPDFINQYFRGELFILVDNLLTRKSPFYKEDHTSCLQLFKAYIAAGVKFATFTAENIKEIGKEAINDPNVINVSSKHAVLHALAEFFFTFNSFVAKDKRTNFHYLNRTKLSVEESIKELKDCLVKHDLVAICTSIMEFANPPYKGYPWSVKKEVLTLLKTLKPETEFPAMSDNKEILELLDYMSYFKSKEAFPSEMLDKKQIELTLNLVITGNFESRLKGMNELKKVVDEVSRSRRDILREQLPRTNLLMFLTDNSNFNGEIFKRSIPIFQFAHKSELLTNDLLHRILGLHKDKHELELKSFYSGLSEFGKFLSKEQILYFFEAITKLPLDEHLVTLVKEYTLNAIDYHPYFRARFQEKGSGLGVVFFWGLMEDKERKMTPQLKSEIVEAFSALLVNIYYEHQKEKYITAAIEGIRQRRNIDEYLKMVQSCLKMSKNVKIESLLKNFEREGSLIDEVICAVLETSSQVTEKGIQSMFQFLQEVSTVSKKGITVEHIRVLWKLPGCQSHLLNWMRKYKKRGNEKSYDKIVHKQLSETKMKDIMTCLFLSEDLMEGYREVSEELFQTVDEMLVSYNYHHRAIEYNIKHTIRVIRLDELFGLGFYLNVGRNCRNDKMADRAIRRFIEYYLRPSIGKSYFSSQNQVKVNSWVQCLEKLQQLDSRVFLGFKLMLEEIQGRMKSLTILEPSIVNIVVLLKPKNIEKTILLPRYSSLWKLRQAINQEFGLKDTNFEMLYTKSNSTSDMIKEEDYSLALIYEPMTSGPTVVVTPSKEIHPHVQTIENFKTHLSNLHGEKLLECLSVHTKEQQSILSILNAIPAVKNIEKKMTKLDVTNWQDILDTQCKAKLAYQLKLISQIKSTPGWPQQFIKKKGIDHIAKILLTKSSTLELHHYSTLADLLEFFAQILMFFKLEKTPLPFEHNFVLELMQVQQHPTPQTIEYHLTLFKVFKELANYPETKLPKLLSHPAYVKLLEVVLFSPSNLKKWEKFPQIVLDLTEKSEAVTTLLSQMENFLNMGFLVKNSRNCLMFFNLLILLFDKNIVTESLFTQNLDFIAHIRKDESFIEEDEDEPNELILGWLRMVNCLVLKKITAGNKIKIFKEPETEASFGHFLMKDCLFDHKHRLKSMQSRRVAFEILSCLNCEAELATLNNELIVPMMLKGSWRRETQWSVKPFQKRKSGYVGLKNLAATCYINSLLQQLFWIKSFREPLLSIEAQEIEDNENIAYEVQKIFAHLKWSDSDVMTTLSLCNRFILDGQPIDPRIQTDADEFFHALMDKLERNLAKINKKNLIDDVFRGELSNLIIGQECPHKSERVEHFLSMRLQILQKKSLDLALDDFIKGEILQGDNAYFCDKCDKKVKALKRVCVKELPKILILTLKRFQFDFDTMQRYKLNSFCEFPQRLDMLPYMRETLFQDEEKLPPENYQFQLKGVLIHYGISEAGHYTSYVRTPTEWKYFDDDKVFDFDTEELPNQCFGGIEENPYGDDEDKLKNAYILFYEKVAAKDEAVEHSTHPHIEAEVEEENRKNQLVKMLFEESFEAYMNNKAKSNWKAYLLYVHLVLLRSEQRNKFLSNAFKTCCALLSKETADWYLSQVGESFLMEFVMNACYEVRFFVSALIIECLEKANNPEFLKRCIKCVQKNNMVPLNKIFQAASTFPHYLKILNDYSLGEKMYRLIREDKEPTATSAMSKIKDVRSEFGHIPVDMVRHPQKRDRTELLVAIENLNINIQEEELEMLSMRTRKLVVQVSLAKLVAQRFKEKQKFNDLVKKFLGPKLTKQEPKIDEEHSFNFGLILIMAYCQMTDDLSSGRITLLAELYLMAIKESLEGYKAMRLLMEGLFNIGFGCESFRNEMVSLLSAKENKKVVKMMKDWIKESDKFYQNVSAGRMGYWRKPTRYSYVPQSQLTQIENDVKIKSDSYLSMLNSLLEKHQIELENQWAIKARVGDDVLILSEYTGTVKYRVVDKMGHLLEVSNVEVPQRFIFEDDVYMVLR